MKINPLGVCAAEITDIDCSNAVGEQFAAVKAAYLQYPVLVFRNQKIGVPQLASFSRQFGFLENYAAPAQAAKPNVAALQEKSGRETPDQNLYVSPEDSDVLIMTNEVRQNLPHIGIVDNAEMWHSDGSHKEVPYQAIMVHVVRNPASGGDTEFCDLRAIYEAFPQNIRDALNGRNAMHHWSKSRNPRFAGTLDAAAIAEGERIATMVPEMRQPLVRTHPETGQQSLYASPRFTLRIENIPPEHSDGLLNTMFAMMDEPRFVYRHEWREGDVMIWDNRCLNHRVCSYPSADIRTRHRVTVSGDRPFFRAA